MSRPIPPSVASRCAIYARYSSEAQREASIDDQVRTCRAHAAREGWAVVQIFSDYAVSGSTTLRPGYQALLAEMRRGTFDIVLAESLDRLSRDQEHVAALHKQARFAEVRVVTLAEGEVSELHIGLKGTMGALYLRDLADKTRRGLEGRVREGRSGGGLCYGYRVVRGAPLADGSFERGLREIEPAEAAVVMRIFERFAAGDGPKSIAMALNREGIPGPRGGAWQAGTIRGQALRETGLLRNRLYIGELVWNRQRWIKDPATGRRLARRNDEAERVVEAVPELRIVEDALWQRVQERLAAHRAAVEADPTTGAPRRRFWEQTRPKHLLCAKVMCGACGASFTAAGRDYLACRTVVTGGSCANRRHVRRDRLEAQVLAALRHAVMQPEAIAAFVEEFSREWNRGLAERSAAADGRRRELEAVRRKLSGLIDAMADGYRAPDLQQRPDDLVARRAALEAEVSAMAAGTQPPRLHGNLAQVYCERLDRLSEALSAEGGTEVREALRALVDRVVVHADRVELVGALTALLRAAGVELAANAESPSACVAEGLAVRCSVELDAGTGFEPVTFRL
jgi:site-specific DNA recombinase